MGRDGPFLPSGRDGPFLPSAAVPWLCCSCDRGAGESRMLRGNPSFLWSSRGILARCAPARCLHHSKQRGDPWEVAGSPHVPPGHQSVATGISLPSQVGQGMAPAPRCPFGTA